MRALVVTFAALLTIATISALVYGQFSGGHASLGIASPADLLGWISGDSLSDRVFTRLRLPRILGTALIGAGLATAGCVFQACLRNPLAEPFTLGVSSGSALAAVIAIRLGLGSLLGLSGIGVAALAGAFLSIYIVRHIARVERALPTATLLLAGVTLAMFCGALTMLVQFTADSREVYRMVRWMMGGLDGIHWNAISVVAPITLAGIGVFLWMARDFNALAAGEEAAASLGTNPHRTVSVALSVSALVVGSGIAIAGPIGFVGLMVPHFLRARAGADHRLLVPLCALGGAAFLCACDLLARVLLFPAELPVGVITALLGGPFFLNLLVREKSKATLWG